MATFDEHINQAKKNLDFLQRINEYCKDHYDWQVTVCFYSCLHLVNAHLSIFSLQYRKHKDVKAILNPYSMSPAKLPPDEYASYVALQSLSRRARYLVNEKDDNLAATKGFFTYDKHLDKALKHADRLLGYFENRYKVQLGFIKINCPGVNYTNLKYFKPS